MKYILKSGQITEYDPIDSVKLPDDLKFEKTEMIRIQLFKHSDDGGIICFYTDNLEAPPYGSPDSPYYEKLYNQIQYLILKHSADYAECHRYSNFSFTI